MAAEHAELDRNSNASGRLRTHRMGLQNPDRGFESRRRLHESETGPASRGRPCCAPRAIGSRPIVTGPPTERETKARDPPRHPPPANRVTAKARFVQRYAE